MAEYKITGQSTYPHDIEQMCRRRVRPLLDSVGTQTRTLEHLLAEAYVLGIKDAVDHLVEEH